MTAGTLGLALALGGAVFMPGVASAESGAPTRTFDLTSEDYSYTVPAGVCGVTWTVVGGFGFSGNIGLGDETGTPGKVVVTTLAKSDAVFDVVVGGPGDSETAGGASSVAPAVDEPAPFVIAHGGGDAADNYVGDVYATVSNEQVTTDTTGSVVIADPIDCVVLTPADLTVTSPVGGSATLTWTPGTGPGLDATDWQYTTDGIDGTWKSLPDVTGDSDAKSATLTDLDGTYDFAVRGVNGSQYGAASNVVPLTVAAADVTDPVAGTVLGTAGSTVAGQIDLTFTTAHDGVTPTSFKVTTDGGGTWTALPALLDGETQIWSASVGPLTGNRVYSVGVLGVVDGIAGPPSAYQDVTVAARVTAAAVLGRVTSARVGEVDFTFTYGPGATPNGHEYSIDGGRTWEHLDTGHGENLPWDGILRDLTPGAELSVGVRGLLDGVAGSPSAFKPVTVAAPVAAAPVLGTVTSTRVGEVDLTFTDGSIGETPAGYQVSTDGGERFVVLTGAQQDATTHQWSATLKQLTPGAAISVVVRGVVGGVAGPSSQAKPATVMAPAPVAANLVLNTVTSTRVGLVDLGFSIGAGMKPTDYEASTDGGTTWKHFDSGGPSDADRGGLIEGLTPGATYSVSIRGVLNGVPGLPSASKLVTVAKAVTQVPDNGGDTPTATVPNAPTSVSAVTDSAQVVVTWAAPAGGGAVDHYVVTLFPSGQTKSTKGLTVRFGAEQGKAYTATVVAVSADDVAGPGASATTPEVAAAPEIPATVPDAPLTLTTDKGQITKAAPGEKITVIGDGFLPFSTATVIIYSEPQVLGTVVTDATGSFRLEVEVPAGLEAGQHSLVASGVGTDGTERFMRMNVTVDAAGVATAATTEGGLAYTGFEPVLPITLGLGAVLVGGFVLLLVRRRRVAQD